ncbi:MAG: hypothetical protein AB7G39_04050 [Alphaproteobacteria bacterium]
MPDPDDDLEARLGRTLAETAMLNDPGRAAARTVRQAAPDGMRAARNRRRFRLALAAAALLLLAAILLALHAAPG